MKQKPLICPNCGTEVFPIKYGTSSFVCFNCETEVYQISLSRTLKTIKNGKERNTGIRNLEIEIFEEERSDSDSIK